MLTDAKTRVPHHINAARTLKEKSGIEKPQKNHGTDISELISKSEFVDIVQYGSYSSKKLIQLSKSLRHPSVEHLHEEFGYNRSILKLAGWVMAANQVEVTHDSLNEYFWKLMDLRMVPSSRIVIEKWTDNIDKIETDISAILKKRSKNYLTCFNCKKNQVSVLYLPCGHLIVCSQCHQSAMKHCQACGCTVAEYHTVYI